MKLKFSRNIIAGITLFASAAGIAHAGLLLSGNTAGFFQSNSNPNTSISNSADGLFSTFRTGIPAGGSFQSGIDFHGHEFTGLGSGEDFSLGLLTYRNGITKIGTSSGLEAMDLYLNLDDPALGMIYLTTITFEISSTINSPGLTPDVFTASFTQPPARLIGHRFVTFKVNALPNSVEVREGATSDLASVSVLFLDPVPEPATYGLCGSLALIAIGAYRRLQRRSLLLNVT